MLFRSDVLARDRNGLVFRGFVPLHGERAPGHEEVGLAEAGRSPQSDSEHVQIDKPVLVDVEHRDVQCTAQPAERLGAHLEFVAEPRLMDPAETPAQAERHAPFLAHLGLSSLVEVLLRVALARAGAGSGRTDGVG